MKKESTKKILLILIAIVMLLVVAPFYLLYAICKTLCDTDGWVIFCSDFWTYFLFPIDIEKLKWSEKYLRDENEKLKKRIEELEGKK